MLLSPRHLLAVLVLLISLPAQAHQEPEADPAAYLQAFNDSCRQGFPDLDMIAAHVVTQGWTETTPRIIAGAGVTQLPRIFHRNGLLLSLIAPMDGDYRAVCQVTGSGSTRLTSKDVAAIVSPSLNAGDPVPGPGDPKQDDMATWTVAPGISVQAGINVYRRKVRSLSMSVKQTR
ncbi:hypothetical protein [Sphingobium sp. Z007]|uniref:hypothetical protein n=1 Tax=Sphingobium sp. Z007 TaxID=627495 RepID=UPI000B498E2E|nr:hypothetical protein [Sphingobium sp. Z007]